MKLEFGSLSPSEKDIRSRKFTFAFSGSGTKELVRELYSAMRRAEIKLQIAEEMRRNHKQDVTVNS